jgi:3-hydroxybutyryl-CoA dehydratase
MNETQTAMDPVRYAETHDVPRGREIKPGMYGLNDVEIGDYYDTEGVTVTETHVVNFAGVSGDHYNIHVDDVAAQEAGFPQRIAHGLLGLSLADGLRTRCPVQLKGIANLGWKWSFHGPLMINDRIHVAIKIIGKRVTRSNPTRGVVTKHLQVINQRGEVIQSGETMMMMPTRLD